LGGSRSAVYTEDCAYKKNNLIRKGHTLMDT